VTTGERFQGSLAQDLGSLNGKLLRLNDDGSVPNDNPFFGTQGARGEVYSYGHRNPQGLSWQPGTGRLFVAEHGPSGSDAPGGGDEVNFVEAGKNYGWPGSHHDTVEQGTVGPIKQWTPAIAPGSCAFYTGTEFSDWTGDLFVACLRGRGLMRVELDGAAYSSATKLFEELGRCREVVMGPDGAMYFTTSNKDGRGQPGADDDKLLKIVPK
jgi:glucose/arabinose dehydrogenase